MFTQKPLGKFHVKVCRTLSCQLAGSNELLQRLKDLGADFTVSTVECLAACGTAPVMMINDEHYDNVTPERLDQSSATSNALARSRKNQSRNRYRHIHSKTHLVGEHYQARLHRLAGRLRKGRRLSGVGEGVDDET